MWLLSQAHLAVFNMTKQEEKGNYMQLLLHLVELLMLLSHTVPANYSYLPDDSTLNNLYLIMDSLSSKASQYKARNNMVPTEIA